ncbi:hydroxymethylglutaryl-CoA reductase, class I/II [Tanacetum coccineum]
MAQGLKKHTNRLNAPTPKSLESWRFSIFITAGQDLAQNIQNSHRIAMMEVVNGGKDLNVSVTMPAIENTSKVTYSILKCSKRKFVALCTLGYNLENALNLMWRILEIVGRFQMLTDQDQHGFEFESHHVALFGREGGWNELIVAETRRTKLLKRTERSGNCQVAIEHMSRAYVDDMTKRVTNSSGHVSLLNNGGGTQEDFLLMSASYLALLIPGLEISPIAVDQKTTT